MLNQQTTKEIPVQDLLPEVLQMRGAGARLVQICCTKKERFEITYTFTADDADCSLKNLRVTVTDGARVESVGDIYPYAFVYENELKDLFGINIANLKVDFKGNFYKLAMKTPYNPKW